MSRTVRKAVSPVAGFGTRFLPATKAMPKELLPIVDKPLIQYAVEEAIRAGIDTLIFLTGRNKRAIEDHFDASLELRQHFVPRGSTSRPTWFIISCQAGWSVFLCAKRSSWAWATQSCVLTALSVMSPSRYCLRMTF